MKTKPNDYAENHRVTGSKLLDEAVDPRYRSDASFGNNGLFIFKREGIRLRVIISDQQGWDHVSVSAYKRTGKERTPSWEEMCFIKDIFFKESEMVIQYHPAKKEYVNIHNHCLHMWKPHGVELPTPPKIMV